MIDLCRMCGERYDTERDSVACPHEIKIVIGDIGWKLDPDVTQRIDQAYFADDMGAILCYIEHSNPLIRAYASQKIDALKFARAWAAKGPQVPEEERLRVTDVWGS
jgi:hypothetical protein